MAITNDSKAAIKVEIDKLENEKSPIIARIKSLTKERDALIIQRDILNVKITNLRADIA